MFSQTSVETTKSIAIKNKYAITITGNLIFLALTIEYAMIIHSIKEYINEYLYGKSFGTWNACNIKSNGA